MELDPLLKDLAEKKVAFRKKVASLAAELKDVRLQLALKEEAFAREILTRKDVETKARSMEEELGQLRRCLEERNGQLQAYTFTNEQYLKELDQMRSQIVTAQATAEASAGAAQAANFKCSSLQKELKETHCSPKDHDSRIYELGEQLSLLQRNLQAREFSQKLQKDEVLRIEEEVMYVVEKTGIHRDLGLRNAFAADSPTNVEMGTLQVAKDEEIAQLRDEIKFLSANCQLKNRELESQVFSPEQREKHRATDQEMKKRILKLELCLQEARTQIRQLRKRDEKREDSFKELRDQITAMKQPNTYICRDGRGFWESHGFNIMACVCMFFMVIFAKR